MRRCPGSLTLNIVKNFRIQFPSENVSYSVIEGYQPAYPPDSEAAGWCVNGQG